MQRLYVRSILESVYSSTETDQIISTAARNATSVLDAAIALRVNAEPLQIVVEAARKRAAPAQAEKPAKRRTDERKNQPTYVKTSAAVVRVSDSTDQCVVQHIQHSPVAMHTQQQHFITGKD